MTLAVRGGATRGPATLVSLVILGVVSGCVTAGSVEPARTSTDDWDDFAATAEPLAAPTTTSATTAVRPRQRQRTPTTSTSSIATSTARTTTTTTTVHRNWDTVLAVADPRGDVGLTERRPYADVLRLRIADSGKDARLIVTVADTVPRRLAGGEVVGIGVDFYRTDSRESDYQVFVDGGTHGWRAFLHTPRGVVRFPGTLRIVDRRFVIDVPWSSLGGRVTADVSAFADWSQRDTIAASTQDVVPDSGTRRMVMR